MKKRIAVTGANGFVGSALCEMLMDRGYFVRRLVRSESQNNISSRIDLETVVIGEIGEVTNWSNALKGIDCVIHCAARVHVMKDLEIDPLFSFRQVNVAGTLNLAQQAIEAGVNRFIFLSSIKVNGEETELNLPYFADDIPAPEDAYGISKSEAEIGLRDLVLGKSMEVVIIRPPLIYGAGVKGNLNSLMNWVRRGLPLPVGAVTKNRRSFVALENLLDLLIICIDHQNAANQTFLVSDGEDISTADLLQRIGVALHKKVYLLPVPLFFLNFAGVLLRKKGVLQRLLGSLQLDITKTCSLLGWKPAVSIDEGMRKMIGKKYDATNI